MRAPPKLWMTISTNLFFNPPSHAKLVRCFSTSVSHAKSGPSVKKNPNGEQKPSGVKLTHLRDDGAAHMVSIASKAPTKRIARAGVRLFFSNPHPKNLISDKSVPKGDAFAVARIAGIQAAKKTSDLIPLAHPGLGITGVTIDFKSIDHPHTSYGGIQIVARVDCEGKTGVEMEALTAVTVAGLALFDMFKGVDRSMSLTMARILHKEGGRSGVWQYSSVAKRMVKTMAGIQHYEELVDEEEEEPYIGEEADINELDKDDSDE